MKREYLLAGLLAILLKLIVLATALLWIQIHKQPLNLCAWDCVYYRDIAVTGYYESPGRHGPMAFFPLFPKLIGFLGGGSAFDFSIVAIVLNLLCFGVTVALLGQWSHMLGLKAWWLPGLLWSSDRFTLWSHVPYTESIFCLLLMCFLLTMRSPKSTKSLLLAATLGGFASATRIVGLSFVTAIGLSEWRRCLRRPLLGTVLLALGSLGTVLFFGYLHWRFGSWTLSFQTTANWGRHFSLPGFFDSLVLLLRSFYFPTLPLLTATLVGIVWSRKLFSSAERLLFALLIFVPMASSVQVSLTRYLSVLVLGYVVVSFHLEKQQLKPWVRPLVVVFVVSEALWQVALTIKFFRTEVFLWAA
jgi:hypothetical protein